MGVKSECPLCGKCTGKNIKVCSYHRYTLAYPELNWDEANEISPEDIEAAANIFDNLKNHSHES